MWQRCQIRAYDNKFFISNVKCPDPIPSTPLDDIKSDVDILAEKKKARLVKQTFESHPQLKMKKISKEQAIKSLESIPSASICGKGTVYLPENARNNIINEFQIALPSKKGMILQKTLRYQPANDSKNCLIKN